MTKEEIATALGATRTEPLPRTPATVAEAQAVFAEQGSPPGLSVRVEYVLQRRAKESQYPDWQDAGSFCNEAAARRMLAEREASRDRLYYEFRLVRRTVRDEVVGEGDEADG